MDYSQSAVKAALEGRWKEATADNLAALKENPKDTEVLNRLGRAYLETGQKTKAIETYQKVLKIDKFNTIAQKNLVFLKNTKMSKTRSQTNASYKAPVFLEEPGITKTVALVRLSDTKVLSKLHPADPVLIACRQHAVCVVTTENESIGRLPDDLAARLREFINAGNTYSAWIRSIEVATSAKHQSMIKVFIRELTRVPAYKFTPSFPLTEKLSYAAFTPPELIHEEKPDVSATEEQEDTRTSEGNEDLSGEEARTPGDM